MRPIGPDLGFPLAPILNELQDAANEQLVPTKPKALWSVLYAALPPAADWPGCLVYVSDKSKAGLSNGTTWTDPAGGAL